MLCVILPNLVITHALAMPETERISLGEALIVAAVGAQSGQGQVHLSVELELFPYDLESGRALVVASASWRSRVGTPDGLLEDRVFHIPDVIR